LIELRELTEHLARTRFPEISVPQATADLVILLAASIVNADVGGGGVVPAPGEHRLLRGRG